MKIKISTVILYLLFWGLIGMSIAIIQVSKFEYPTFFRELYKCSGKDPTYDSCFSTMDNQLINAASQRFRELLVFYVGIAWIVGLIIGKPLNQMRKS